MSEVKRYDVQGRFESTSGEGISLLNPKMVLEEDYDAKCHAADVYFGSWKRTEQELDAQRLRADTAEAGVQASVEVINSLHNQLAAAEQRIAELIELLKIHTDHVADLADSLFRVGACMGPQSKDFERKIYAALAQQQVVFAALNPNPEAESHE